MNKKHLLFLALLVSAIEATPTLSPKGPTYEVISATTIGASVTTAVSVSGSTDGFLIVCEDGNDNLDTRFFDIGSQEWGTLFQTPDSTTNIGGSSNGPNLISNTTGGAMISWLGNTVGISTGYAYAGFTSNYGSSWESIIPLENVDSEAVLVSVSGTTDGFMFVWLDFASSTTTPYWAWSTYADSSWSIAAQGTIPNVGPCTISGNSPAIVAGTIDTGFMAAWVNTSNNIYASYSSNGGGTWTTQQVTTTGDVICVWIGSNADGFMAVWVDADYNAYSLFYSFDSELWQEVPVLIASSLSTVNLNTPYVTGSGNYFVVSWIGVDNNAYASISDNEGTTWSSPTSITTDESVNNQSGFSLYNFGYSVGAAMVGDTVLFTWLDASGNAQSRFYTASAPSATPSSFSKGGFFEPIIPNRPNGGLFH